MMNVPPRSRTKAERARETLVLRWQTLALAMLVAALFGLLSGVAREVRLPGGVLAAEGNPETPHLAKREPLRAVLSADRKDAGAAHWNGFDGSLLANALELPLRLSGPAIAGPDVDAAALASSSNAFQARAPPHGT